LVTVDEEERTLGWDTDSAGEPVRAGRALAEHLIGRPARYSSVDLQTEKGQTVGIPSLGGPARRLGYYQKATDPQEGSTAFGGGGRPGETPGHDAVDRRPQLTAPGDLGSLADDLDSVGQPQLGHGVLQEFGPGPAPVEEDPAGGGPHQGQRQAGEAATAAQVHRPGRH
jgi:hypothetical protein